MVTGTTALSLTWRHGPLALDMSAQGTIIPAHEGVDPGESVRYDLAWGYQFALGQGNAALVPVLELNGESSARNRLDGSPIQGTGGTRLFVSPGLQIPLRDLILEGSLEVPIYNSVSWSRNADDLRWTGGVQIRFWAAWLRPAASPGFFPDSIGPDTPCFVCLADG